MEVSKTLRHDGAVVFWSLSDLTERTVLNTNLAALGLSPVEQRSPMSVLQDAIEQVHGTKNRLVKPLSKHQQVRGFCVSEIRAGLRENQYPALASYWLDAGDTVQGQGPAERTDDVAWKFRVLRDTLRPAQVSAMLLQALARRGSGEINGLRLNPNGFAYWIPEDGKPKWEALTAAVQAAAYGTTTFYALGHRFDADGIRAVRDALVREAEQECREIEADVESGKLKERALNNRVEQARAMRGKVELYEALLGETIQGVRQQLDKAEEAAALAAMLAAVETAQDELAKLAGE